jgi:hypothetical protein
MLKGWVQKLQAAWAGRAQIAADFMSKWDSDDAWLRGQFQGEVLGWVMMTALLMLATAGASSLAAATGTWASILRALAAVDALGDVMAYVGAAARLPGTAVAVLQRRFGKVANTAAEVGGDLSDAERAISNAGETGEIAKRNQTSADDTGREALNTARTKQGTPGNEAGEIVSVHGYAQGPTIQWVKNRDGATRTIHEAMEIARKNGVEIPDDMLFKKVSGRSLPDKTYAEYFSRKRSNPSELITWDDFYSKDLDQLLVRIESSVFESDEAIVAIFAHEMHELNNLRRLFEETGGSMTLQRLHYLITPGIKGNLHDHAWDVADKLVVAMRKASEATP